MALSRRGDAIAASSARDGEKGEKARNGRAWIMVCVKSLEKLILDVFFVVDHMTSKIGVFPAVFEKLRLLIFH